MNGERGGAPTRPTKRKSRRNVGVAVAYGASLLVASLGVELGPLGTDPNSAAAASKRAKTAQTTTTKSPRSTSVKGASTTATWRSLDVSAKGLKEVSGCAFSRTTANRVWVHNDSGDGPIVVPVDVSTGAVGRSVMLTGVDVVDPEDIASTTDGNIILADIGDNAENRPSIQLYLFPEPAINATSVNVKRLDVTYPDGPHNAEAFAVSADAASALIVTKDETGVADVFRVDLTVASSQVASRVGQITIKGETGYKANMISAADTLGASLVLRSFQHGYLLRPATGGGIVEAAAATPRKFSLPQMAQGEALCVSPDGQTLVTASESQGASTFALAVGPVPR